ncbi:hypothetical protein C5167_019899 [Papaver somniferum]|uniref:Uncharacterized protein n=1 Tax=Papaver somniferum TaxID=3469 RepID=A0A4Y7IRH8_PAPSO|nr:hypothetical protein C5167_019899 [Papaver somniferum]
MYNFKQPAVSFWWNFNSGNYNLVLESLEGQHDDERRKKIIQEIQWHASSNQECNLDPTAENTHHSLAAKYVKFLLATASSHLDIGHLETQTPAEKFKIAAFVLGVWLSARLAKLIKPVISPIEQPHRFSERIDRYSSDEFEASTEKLCNWLSDSLRNEEPKVLGGVYHHAMKLEVLCGFLMLAKLIPVSLMRNRPEERLVPIYDFNFTCATVDYLQFSMQNPDRRAHPGNMYFSDSVAIPLPNTGRTPPWNRISVSNLRRSVGMAAGLHWESGTPSNSLSISRTAPVDISVRTTIYSQRFYKCNYCGFRIASLANISLMAQLFGQDLPIPSVMVIHPPLTTVIVQHTNETEQTPDGLGNNLLCGMCEEQIGKCFVVAAAELEIWVLHLPCLKLEPSRYERLIPWY